MKRLVFDMVPVSIFYSFQGVLSNSLVFLQAFEKTSGSYLSSVKISFVSYRSCSVLEGYVVENPNVSQNN